jgi:hypothetical protein
MLLGAHNQMFIDVVAGGCPGNFFLAERERTAFHEAEAGHPAGNRR